MDNRIIDFLPGHYSVMESIDHYLLPPDRKSVMVLCISNDSGETSILLMAKSSYLKVRDDIIDYYNKRLDYYNKSRREFEGISHIDVYETTDTRTDRFGKSPKIPLKLRYNPKYFESILASDLTKKYETLFEDK